MLGSRRLNLRSGPLARPLRAIRRALPPVNFITLHYAYFIVTCLFAAVIFWGSSTPAKDVAFTDALFLCVSAMTEAGLNTLNLSELNTWQQIMLLLLIFIGSAIFVSNFVLQVRRRAFEHKFRSIIEARAKRSHRRSSSRHSGFSLSRRSTARSRDPETQNDLSEKYPSHDFAPIDRSASPTRRGRPLSKRSIDDDQASEPGQKTMDDRRNSLMASPDRITFSPETVFRSPRRNEDQISPVRQRTRVFSVSGVGARPDMSLHRTISASRTSIVLDDGPPGVKESTADYFPSSGYISRNSQFHNLTEAERQRLGGVEYKALLWLSWIVPLYLILWQLLGALGCAAWVARNRPDTASANGLNPWWVGAFNAVSAFNNSGMSLLDANMVAFQTSYYLLLTMGLLILAGNTCYPIFLRLIVWTILKLMPKTERWEDNRNTLRFLLDHPRRCYTNLFPSEHTWWLAFAVFVLNGIDWAAFEILNIGNHKLNDSIPVHIRVLDGLFQAFAVRSGGFYVVSITSVRISLQVLYVIMMYISVYPVVITMRNSNVYEERSLGVYTDGLDDAIKGHQDPNSIWTKVSGFKQYVASGFGGLSEGKSYFLQQQLRAQLAHDAWWIVLAVFLIMIIEGGQFERSPETFSVFNVIFEVVSGYGTVGISVGVPDNAYSFCGSWHKLSKLILCAVMIRGRHRGLPIAIDRAVLLPDERQDLAEEEDAVIRMERAVSRGHGGEVV